MSMRKTLLAFYAVSGVAVGAGVGVFLSHADIKMGAPGSEANPHTAIQDVADQVPPSRLPIAYDESSFHTLYNAPQFTPTGFAGDFLASHFAQSQYDWTEANKFLDNVLKNDPENAELLKRSMVLAVGSGDINTAATRAKALLKADPENNLALLVLVVKDMAGDNYQAALDNLEKMPQGDITAFIKPILAGWAEAGLGKYSTKDFADTPFHNFHKAMINLYLGKKEAALKALVSVLNAPNLGPEDAERAGDMLVQLGKPEKALPLYKGALLHSANNPELENKITLLEQGKIDALKKATASVHVANAGQGAALTFYDMSALLFRELSDSSAKIFGHMALALDPQMIDADILLADIATRNGRYDSAINHLEKIPADNPLYLLSQQRVADLWVEEGQQGKAIELLQKLYTEKGDIDSLIRIGDIYRQQEDYKKALTAYNNAADKIGKTIPEEYWYLLYARGMAYERDGQWTKAEADLEAALKYRPNHPYLLNYLGYSWADQGKKLKEAKALIEKAATLRPQDGYIVDSLGWVTYMMGDYKESVPYLERAVELEPYDGTINDHLGDAYWKVGRKFEARFQWERALNYGEDKKLNDVISKKLKFGPDSDEAQQAAKAMKDAEDAAKTAAAQ